MTFTLDGDRRDPRIVDLAAEAAKRGYSLLPDEPTREEQKVLKELVYNLFVDWQEDREQLRSVYPKLREAMIAAGRVPTE